MLGLVASSTSRCRRRIASVMAVWVCGLLVNHNFSNVFCNACADDNGPQVTIVYAYVTV